MKRKSMATKVTGMNRQHQIEVIKMLQQLRLVMAGVK